MPRPLKVREVLRILRRDGWTPARPARGSHRQLKHPTKRGTVTVAGNEGDEIDAGTLSSIFEQAGLPWPPATEDVEGKRKKKP